MLCDSVGNITMKMKVVCDEFFHHIPLDTKYKKKTKHGGRRINEKLNEYKEMQRKKHELKCTRNLTRIDEAN